MNASVLVTTGEPTAAAEGHRGPEGRWLGVPVCRCVCVCVCVGFDSGSFLVVSANGPASCQGHVRAMSSLLLESRVILG